MAVANKKIEYGLGATASWDSSITWRAKLAVASLLAVWLYAFWPTLCSIISAYWDPHINNYAFAAIILFVILLAKKIPSLHRVAPNVDQIGLIIILGLSLIWGFAYIAKFVFLEQLSVIALIPAIVYACCGARVTKVLAYPLAFIFFSLPAGYLLIQPLQAITSYMLIKGFVVLGLTVFWDSTSIQTMFNTLDIIEILKPLHYIPTIFMLGSFMSFLIVHHSIRKAIGSVLFLFVPYLSVLLGIFFLALLQEWQNASFLTEKTVKAFSWGFFLLGTSTTVFVVFFMRGKQVQKLSDLDWKTHIDYANLRWLRPSVIAALVMISMPWITENIQVNPWKHKKQINLESPILNRWEGPLAGSKNWQPYVPYTTVTLSSSYLSEAEKEVNLFLAYYGHSLEASALTSTENELFDKREWTDIKQDRYFVNIAPINDKFEVLEIVLNKAAQHRLIWYWYFVGDTQSAKLNLVKTLESIRVISKKNPHAGMVAIATDFNVELAEGRKRLTDFLQELIPKLEQVKKTS